MPETAYKIKLRKCCKCGTDKSSNGKWNKYYDDKNNWDGKSYLCNTCKMREYNDKIIKPTRQCRTRELSRYSTHGKGFIGAQIVAKTNGLEDCNIKMDNFCFYVDLSRHTKYGTVEVKTATLNIEYLWWGFSGFKPENSDTTFLVCMDDNEPWKNVERIYKIPSNNIEVTTITIFANTSMRMSKWGKFKIDENPYNNTYHNMKLENCKVLKLNE